MQSNLEKLRSLLSELFQLDQADLDFGIYRIMNQKRDEISHFLEKDLLPQVQEAFGFYKSADKAELEEDLEKTIQGAKAAGFEPEESPKVKEIRESIAKYGVDTTALENEVFSDLYNFFRRYYHEGDFLSLRRYKKGVYAIPYEGEEVKLHWANHDQYYIKTSEYFRAYTFKLPSGKCVHFKLVEADTEKDNIKAQTGNERRFILCEEEHLEEKDGELYIRFQYVPDPEKRKQKELNSKAVDAILNTKGFIEWRGELARLMPTDKNPERTLLEKHLTDYTARNTFDYFIHKDLGGFLKRELDFYIKNEIMHLDDIENETAPRVNQYLSKIKVIRKIAHKIIDFLAQIENFQKKLWLKKKFVVETNYCVTLDRVPEELYPEIVTNEEQREEWVKLFAIDEIEGNLIQPAYLEPLTVELLKANQFLAVDTKFFDDDFKNRLVTTINDFDKQCDGLLIHSENFQALNLLQELYREKVKCTYIDPPYNSSSTEILYKNNYKHSSWLSLMNNRLQASQNLVEENGIVTIAIDENEQEKLAFLLNELYPNSEKTCVTVIHNPGGIQGDNFKYTNEYAYFIYPRKNKVIQLQDRTDDADVRPLRDVSKGDHLRSSAANCFYPIYVKDSQIVGFGDVCDDSFHPPSVNLHRGNGIIEIYPIDAKGNERKWVFARNSVEDIRDELEVRFNDRRQIYDIIRTKTKFNYKTVWTDKKYNSNTYGTKLLNSIIGKSLFDFPKSLYNVRDCLHAATGNTPQACILDFFAGSGTTGHALIHLNREDNGQRKYILVEMGEHFDTVLKPRIQKVIYSKDWKDGKPISRQGSSHMFKYIRLESYEDTLNNLELKRTDAQQSLLEQSDSFRESYMLAYMLDVESKGSASLLNIDSFEDPFNYKLKIATGSAGETKSVTVDLVETFNYLIGLTVHHIDHILGFRVIQGTNPKGDKVLVIWRNLKEKSNKDLDEFFRKQEYNPKDMEFDLIYVNGDNNLENLRRDDETWKVRLIEEDFKRLMFDVQDV